MFHPKHVLSSLKNIGKINFKSIVWFIKAINMYICFVLFCFVLFWVFFFVGLFFLSCFCFCCGEKVWIRLDHLAEEWFPTRVQLSSIRIPFCKVT